MNASRPRLIWICLALALALLLLMLAACGGGDGSGDSGGRTGRAKKDRGEAAMMIGGAAWQSSGARASIENGKLKLTASKTDISGGSAKRQELQLLVDDYQGAGDYVSALSGSRFLAVGFDTQPAKDAGGDDQAVTDAVIGALQGATHMTLAGAKVRVTSSDATEIVGTFSWTPAEGSKQPAIEGGTFRAIVK